MGMRVVEGGESRKGDKEGEVNGERREEK